MIYLLEQYKRVDCIFLNGERTHYMAWETIETFEDLQLALQEEENLTRRWSQIYRVLEIQK